MQKAPTGFGGALVVMVPAVQRMHEPRAPARGKPAKYENSCGTMRMRGTLAALAPPGKQL